MANIKNLSVISESDAILGDVMSNNFSQIFVALNSQAVNSENYGANAIDSTHIGANAILSQHLSDSCVNSAKITDSAIRHAHVNWDVPAGGVRMARYGGTASNGIAANGIGVVRLTQTLSVQNADTASYTFAVSWGDAVDGYNDFTTTPTVVGRPVFECAASSQVGPRGVNLTAIDSDSAQWLVSFSGSPAFSQLLTIHVQAIGPVSHV